MPSNQSTPIARFMAELVAEHHLAHLNDRELLRRFTMQREEAAFLALLKRHGTVIQRICRRTLPNIHDADDVFQATFLVLLKKASALRWRDSIAGWLHEVAYRLAANKKRAATWRGIKEGQAAADESCDPLNSLTVNEAQTILHEELNHLPETLRGPLVLCYLENATQEEAARQLGWSLRTLKRRLQRGRDLLHKRLTRRGLTLSAALSTSLLASSPASATLIRTTLTAAVTASGKAGTIAAPVAVLVQGALGSMFLTKLKVVAALTVCFVGTGLVLNQAWPALSNADASIASRIPKSLEPGQSGANKEKERQAIADEPVKEKGEKASVDANGDPLPGGAVARLGSISWRHGSSIINSAQSPDGKLLATVSNNSVVVWDLATGRRVHKFVGDDNYSFQNPGLEFSPDGRRLVYTQHPGFAVVWDLTSGKEIRRVEDPERYPLTGPSQFTPDGEGLVLTQQERTETIKLSTGNVTHSIPVGNIFQISADGKLFLREEGQRKREAKREIHLGDLLTGTTKVRVELEPDGSDLHPGMAYAVLAPDSRSFAVLQSGFGLGFIELRDTAKGKVLATFRVADNDFRLGFTADGKTLWFIAGSGVVYRWDVESRKELATLRPASGHATGYYELGDHKTAVTTRREGWIQHWDRQTGQALSKEEGYFGRTCADFSPDGSLVAVADSRGRMDLWDATRGSRIKVLRETGPGVVCLAFLPDGKRLATVEESGRVQLWEINTGKLAGVLVKEAEMISPKEATLLFSRDGRFIYFGVPLGDAHLLEINSGKPIWSSKGPHAAALATDGRTLIAAVGGTKVTYFDFETGKELKRINVSLPGGRSVGVESWVIESLVSAPDGHRLAVGLYSGQIALLDCRKEPRFESFLLKPQAFNGLIEKIGMQMQTSISNVSSRSPAVKGLAFTRDGNWLVSGRWDDSKVRVHEFLTGREVMHFHGHDSGIMSVAVSPDGRKVLSCGFDGQAYLWDLHPSEAALPRKKVAVLWGDLASEDAQLAYQAIWSLVDLPRESLPFLKEKLRPVAIADKIQKWIADLDSETFTVRQAAAQELAKAGDQVQDPIQRALKGNLSLETRRRLEHVLKSLPDIPGPETIRTIRAIMALERIGTAEARGLLEALAGGAPGARETEEARGSLERVARRAGKAP